MIFTRKVHLSKLKLFFCIHSTRLSTVYVYVREMKEIEIQ